MEKIKLALIYLLIVFTFVSCSSGFEGLAYNMTGVIQMAPKGLSGNDQYVEDIRTFYQENVGDNGIVYKEKIDTALAFDYYKLIIRSTQTTGGDAITGIKNANNSQSDWIAKLPAGNWKTSFLINCADYSGSNSSQITWESLNILLKGSWSGTTSDGDKFVFYVGDKTDDSSSTLLTCPCTFTYADTTWTNTLTYESNIVLVDSIATDSVSANALFETDSSTYVKVLLNATPSETKCYITKMWVKGNKIIDATEMEKGVALKKEE